MLSPDDIAYAGGEPFRNTYPIKEGWNVRLEVLWSDDASVSFLNRSPVLIHRLCDGTKRVDLKTLLKKGQNELIIDIRNEKPPVFGVHYKIGVFDENNTPQYDGIDLEPKGNSNKIGIIASFTYYFPKN